MNERYDFRTKRLFVEQDLSAGVALSIERTQANYLLNVLRLKARDKVLLFNGRDGEWLANIVPTGRKACDLMPTEQLRTQPAPYDLTYCFAPLKQGRLDYMVQKAVEMGAGRLVPVISDYTQIHKLNLERLRANIVEAAEQCGILSIPELEEPRPLNDLIETWPVEQPDRVLIFCDELANASEQAQRLEAVRHKQHAVLIGPEGGFSNKERSLLREQPFVVGLSLGPRILRADTAGVAALAIVQAFIGDLR
ncbi:MAG: 16S rRNA (uracil(1498)-N(3))-methyltransferase [Hyphomicrobiales bacterium]|nr:MAG: 16S rRNA (uracil(1498)-N(3))-methyltransferase [Hyphomicrobiales bacterium]